MKRLLGLAAVALLGSVSTLAAEPDRPRDVYEYYLWFWAQQQLPMKQFTQDLANAHIVRDDKNGWLRLELRNITSTFVVWNGGPSKHRIVGLSRIIRSEDEHGPYETYDVQFGEDVDGRLVLREDLLPTIELRDFWDETGAVPAGKYGRARFEYVLPRKGTSIQVHVHPELFDSMGDPEAPDDGFRYDKYLADFKTAKYSALELVFDKAAGKFVKGAKTLARKGGGAP